MKKLLQKEFRLAFHPTAFLFLALSAMLLIPSYPYYVVFFYTGLGIFFTCLSGRENQDVLYTMLLPVKKSDVVKARFLSVILLELFQMAAAVPFAVLRQHMPVPQNGAGMEANIALFGLCFLQYGLFNFVFFRIYYRDVRLVGRAFLAASGAVFLYIFAAESAVHIVPFAVRRLDTFDDRYIPEKLAVLAAGAALYGLLTAAAYGRAKRDFERQDL